MKHLPIFPIRRMEPDGTYVLDCTVEQLESAIGADFAPYRCPGCGADKKAETSVFFEDSGSHGVMYNLCCEPKYQGFSIIPNDAKFVALMKTFFKEVKKYGY